MSFNNEAVFAHTSDLQTSSAEGQYKSAGIELYAFAAVFHDTPAAFNDSFCV